MSQREEHINRLKSAIIKQFGRTLDAPTDYDLLSAAIQERTNETISSTTLKRLFGYLKPATVPRPSTLSTLARYIGFVGWSDFLNSAYGEKDTLPEKQSRHSTLPYYMLAGASLCVLAFILWLTIPTTRTNQPAVAQETVEQKIKRIKQRSISFAKKRCDSIRTLRERMDIITYKEAVDKFYFPFVFTELKDSIDRQLSTLFPEDDSLATHHRNEIFGLCRDICIELMREIPTDELTKAYRRKSGIH